jgi:hypothetical protein
MTLRNPGAMVDEATLSKPFTAARDGFSINAGVGCEARERGKLERVCRYMARPPITEERLSIDGDGLVVYELKHPFSDGTTHVLFEPVDFIARLAALDCRARIVGTILALQSNARHRHLIVPRHTSPISSEQSENTSVAPTAPMTWMARLKRVFDIDISVCPNCGGQLRVIGEVTEPKTIARILEHVEARERHEHAPRAPPVLLAS